MNFIGSLIKFIICTALALVTIAIFVPFTIFDIVIGIIVNIFGGNWKFSSPGAWSAVFDHWSKGEFMF